MPAVPATILMSAEEMHEMMRWSLQYPSDQRHAHVGEPARQKPANHQPKHAFSRQPSNSYHAMLQNVFIPIISLNLYEL
jgi:hypothetical protein